MTTMSVPRSDEGRPGVDPVGLAELLGQQAQAARQVLALNEQIALALGGPAQDLVDPARQPVPDYDILASMDIAAVAPAQGPPQPVPEYDLLASMEPSQLAMTPMSIPSRSSRSTPLLQHNRPDHHVRTEDFRKSAYMTQERFNQGTHHRSPSHIKKRRESMPFIEERDYKENGLFARLIKHPRFESVTLIMIVVNSLWLGVEADYNKYAILCEAPWIFQVVDNIFCTYFTIELMVRFFALKHKGKALRNGPFLLDVFLFIVMVWETWVQVLVYLIFQRRTGMGGFLKSSLSLRVLRIVRVLRVLRASRSMPVLLTFIEGMLKGVKAVATSLVLLIGVIYIFAILFTQLLGGSPPFQSTFGTVLTSMHFLFLTALCSIDKNFIIQMLNAGWMCWIIWLLFILVANLTIMRMLTGVILSLVQEVNGKNKDTNRKNDMLQTVCLMIDSNDNGYITREEFKALANRHDLMERLVEAGVDLGFFVETMLDSWPEDDEEVSVGHMVTQMVKCRGANLATLEDLLRQNRSQERRIAARLEKALLEKALPQRP